MIIYTNGHWIIMIMRMHLALGISLVEATMEGAVVTIKGQARSVEEGVEQIGEIFVSTNGR